MLPVDGREVPSDGVVDDVQGLVFGVRGQTEAGHEAVLVVLFGNAAHTF